MLPVLVFLALAAFAGALLWAPQAGRAAYLHLILAAGAMPLIISAMSHFIPVLTRTREAGTSFGLVPVLALAGGALAVASLAFPGLAWGRNAGALLALSGAGALLFWSRRRRLSMVGKPHPGLAWYEAALGCLMLALVLIIAASIWPQHWTEFRRLHLHLNTLGLIGMTAVGTLAVLMPTVAGRPDPEAGQWLRRYLPWAFAGTLLTAAGSAWSALLSLPGFALWAIVLLRMGARWLRLHRKEILALHGAAPPLAIALAGLMFSMVLGAAVAITPAGSPPDFDPAAAFVAGFLFPLVTGAASQLLPVWLRPGVQNTWHAELRHRLGRHGGIRSVLFLSGGIVAGLGMGCGLLLGLLPLLWFLLLAAYSVLNSFILDQENSA